MKIETNYQCISGVCDASHFDHYSKDSIQLAQEDIGHTKMVYIKCGLIVK